MYKKFIATFAACALFAGHTQTVQAESCYTGGCGYQECRQCPCLTPAIALGAIALVAIIAVAVQNSNNKHAHCH